MKKRNPHRITAAVVHTNEIVLGTVRVCATHGKVYTAGDTRSEC